MTAVKEPGSLMLVTLIPPYQHLLFISESDIITTQHPIIILISLILISLLFHLRQGHLIQSHGEIDDVVGSA
jgi:hypothetical protein